MKVILCVWHRLSLWMCAFAQRSREVKEEKSTLDHIYILKHEDWITYSAGPDSVVTHLQFRWKFEEGYAFFLSRFEISKWCFLLMCLCKLPRCNGARVITDYW